MALPKQVEQQMKEIEEMERAMQAPAHDDGQTAEPPPDPEPAQPEGTPQEPVQQPTEAVKAEPQEDWQTKYNHLRGKYDNEVPRLHQQNKELASQLAQLQTAVEELKRKPEPASAEDRLITDKDEESFGSDLVDMVRRATKDTLRDAEKAHVAVVNSLQAEIANLKSQLANTSADVTTMTFEQRLVRAVPDWEQVNSDPKWIAWLESPNEYGEPRRVRAEFFYNQGNIAEVQKEVSLFRANQGTDRRRQQEQQRQKELNLQVQPPRNASSQAPQSNAKFYTEAEASRLFDRVRQLNAQGKYEEAQSLEAELTHAYTQGRVRG